MTDDEFIDSIAKRMTTTIQWDPETRKRLIALARIGASVKPNETHLVTRLRNEVCQMGGCPEGVDCLCAELVNDRTKSFARLILMAQEVWGISPPSQYMTPDTPAPMKETHEGE